MEQQLCLQSMQQLLPRLQTAWSNQQLLRLQTVQLRLQPSLQSRRRQPLMLSRRPQQRPRRQPPQQRPFDSPPSFT